MTSTIALLGDIHANSVYGLCPPSVQLYRGGTYHSTPPQRWIYSRFLSYRDEVAEARERAGGRLIIIFTGELADDNKHDKYGLVERHPDALMAVAVDAIRPLLDVVDKSRGDLIYVLRGTEAHSGPDSWMDNKIGADIGAVEVVAADKTVLNSFDVLTVNIDGVRINAAHHPPVGPGRLPWTSTAYAVRLAAHAFTSAAVAGEKPPHLFVRGHYHVPGDSYDAYPTRALALPSWQQPTSYVYRLGGERATPVGGAIVTADRGHYEVAKHYYDWPVRRYEAI